MNNKTLASVVKEAREKSGISQRELSRRTSIDNNTLAKIEKGERKKPNVLSLRKLSYALNLDLEELLILAEYNKQDIEVALNQSNITIFNENSTIILLEDIIKDNENELLAKQILKELMSKVDYEDIDFLKELNLKEKKNAIKNFKKLVKRNDEDIKKLKEMIEKAVKILNKKTDWKEKR